MKFRLAWVLVLFLAACAPVVVDPYSLQQQGETMVQVAQSLQTATAQYYIQEMLNVESTKHVQAGQATGTAQVMALHLAATQTVSTIEQTRQAGDVTATANELSLESTASQGTRFADETASAATPTAEAILLAAQIDRDKAEVAHITRRVWAVVFVVSVALGVALIVWSIYVIVNIRRKLMSRFGRDDVLALDAGKDVNIIDLSKLLSPVVAIRADNASAPRLSDPALQERHNAREQGIRAISAVSHVPSAHRELVEQAGKIMMMTGPTPAALPAGGAPLSALDNWRGETGKLPLGVGEAGLVLADIERNPHFLYAGTTGSGKTYSGLRPLIAVALASQFQVVILDRHGVDFQPFLGHPNAHVIELGRNSERAIAYLRALYNVVLLRQKTLVDAHVSTWGRLRSSEAGARTLLVVDEFSNLADSMPNAGRDDLWRCARMITAEGRKVGVHVAIGIQDPTHRSMDLPTRRNMTPVVFRVQDATASRVVLNADGAETLEPKQFLAGRLAEQIVHGVGFYNEDDDLRAWLSDRPVPILPDPDWLDDAIEDAGALDAAAPIVDPDMARRIHELHEQGVPVTEIAETIFGYKGGAGFTKVKLVLGII